MFLKKLKMKINDYYQQKIDWIYSWFDDELPKWALKLISELKEKMK